MPLYLQAGFWGLLAGSALLIGAGVAYIFKLPTRVVAAVMAIGAGVLISAVSFDLMDEAYQRGGFVATATGFLIGATVYTAANIYISRRVGVTGSVQARMRRSSSRTQARAPAWRSQWARFSTASLSPS